MSFIIVPDECYESFIFACVIISRIGDLFNISFVTYIHLQLLQGLKLGKPSFSENAKCVNVLFIPVDLVIRQKRQINTNESLGQNKTQGVQGTADLQIASPEAAVLNSTSVTQIISSGISQLNTSFGVQLSNLEINSEFMIQFKSYHLTNALAYFRV